MKQIIPFRLRLAQLFSLAMLCCSAAHADYIWMERDATAGVTRAVLAEPQSERNPPSAEDLGDARAFLADGNNLPMTLADGRFLIQTAANQDLRFTAKRVAADGGLIFYQARLGRNETTAVNDLELVPTTPGGNTFKLYWKGNSVAASQVNVYTSQQWTRSFKAAEDGSVTITTPFAGRYVLELVAKVNGSVTLDGKKYDDVRHVATLVFVVER